MKKCIALMSAFFMSLSFVACKSNETAKDGGKSAPSEEVKSSELSQSEELSESSEASEASENSEAGEKTEAKGKKAILIVNGNLGDLGFFDSANRGMERLNKELGLEIQVIETGDEEAKWEPALADAADDEKAEYIVAVSPSMVEPVQKIAPDYPEKKFILIDNTVDFAASDLSNVYCATFKQNEGSFLAGAAAGLITENNKIGFIGGMDIPPINDFLVGYIQGAKEINPDIKVISTYTADYYDPAKGKEHAIVQFGQGADVLFAAAGPSGLGSIEAAVDNDKKIIGVDSDQSSIYQAKGDEKTAKHIITSMMKNVGDTIFRAIQKDLAGELKWGAAESLGVKEKGVELAKNDIFKQAFDEEKQKKLEEIEEKVVNGEIKVDSAVGMDQEKLNELRNSVKP